MCVELCEWLWPIDFFSGFGAYDNNNKKSKLIEDLSRFAICRRKTDKIWTNYPFIEYKWIVFIVIGVRQLCQFIIWTCDAMRMAVMTAVLCKIKSFRLFSN